MAKAQIEPHKIRSPIQLLAVWFATLVIVDGSFLTAAATIPNPPWLAPVLVIAAVVFVPTFLVAAFVMQTRFRPHLQDDSHFAEWQKRQERRVKNFKAENEVKVGQADTPMKKLDETWQEREVRRKKVYESQKGLFLVHAWRPSDQNGWFDIVIWLHQHADGPLAERKVEKVEYHLGPKFFKQPVVKCNTNENFQLEVSAYGPMLCLARVFIKGESHPIDLERYCNFEDGA